MAQAYEGRRPTREEAQRIIVAGKLGVAAHEVPIGSETLEKFTPPAPQPQEPSSSTSSSKPTSADFEPGGSKYEAWKDAYTNACLSQAGWPKESAEEIAERQRSKLPIASNPELANNAYWSSQGSPPGALRSTSRSWR